VPEDKDYKVTDRRRFEPDGTPRGAETPAPAEAPTAPSATAPAEPPTAPSATAPAEPPTAPSATVPAEPAAASLPEVDFTTFVLSLASSAAMHLLGIEEDGARLPPNLPLARQTIDILAMIQQKTKGNLSGEEERLLDHLLYDLRLQYVAASKK
jgi:hypothetical protein